MFNKSLRPRKPEGSLGRTAQDVHLDSHTAPELWTSAVRTQVTFMFTGKEADPVWAAAEITRRPTVVHEITATEWPQRLSVAAWALPIDWTRCCSRLGTLALYLAAFTPSSVTLPCYHHWACCLLTVTAVWLNRPDDHHQPDNDDAEKFCQRWVWIVRNCMSS